MPTRSTRSTSTSRSRRPPRRRSACRRSGPAARPGASGTHRRRSACTPTSRRAPTSDDKGLNEVTGRVEVRPYTGDNPLYRHGPIRVAADRRHFEHADGTPFFWLGDTWWMGLCERLKWPDEFQTLAVDRKPEGLHGRPDRGRTLPGHAGVRPARQERGRLSLDRELRPRFAPSTSIRPTSGSIHLVDQDLVPCVVMAWGYHLPWTGVEKMKKHVRYVIARYGALPVVWCMAGEVNLPYYLEKGFPHGGEKQTADWEGVIQVRPHDQRVRPADHRASHRHRAVERATAVSRPVAAGFRHAPDGPRKKGGSAADHPHPAGVATPPGR